MKRTGTIVAVGAALALLTGCGASAVSASDTAAAETAARSVLDALYSAEAQDSADFEEALAASATNESALQDYLTGKVGDALSSEGLDAVVDNRVVSRVLNAWPASEVSVEQIDLQDAYTETDSQCTYRYTVTAAPDGQDLQTFTGEIVLTLTDGVWQVTSIR